MAREPRFESISVTPDLVHGIDGPVRGIAGLHGIALDESRLSFSNGLIIMHIAAESEWRLL
jgi:hypothetical protein